jgi:hypothetical protein
MEVTNGDRAITRRGFLGEGFVVALALPSAGAVVSGARGAAAAPSTTPWYRSAHLWGQTNITERDPTRYDIGWWRAQWKRTRVEAIIVNAGGIVAYYPSRFPLHRRAEFLGERDLFGELTKAAHDDGIFVMARMDSNRTSEDLFKAHPEWFARDRQGRPYRAGDKYVTCINTPYYEQYLQDVLRELIERSRPDGVTDNSWSGLGRSSICYCASCERLFHARTGRALPSAADWNDPTYRDWIGWSYARRLDLWDLNNRTTRAAGGPQCIWSGMLSGSITTMARSFRDLRALGQRAEIIMLDHQRRDVDTGFQQNGDTGKRVHGVAGWDKVAPESMAMYQSGPGYYRLASKPAAEARMWMIAGMAGGVAPWWHYVGAYHEDRRMYRTPLPVMEWWAANRRYLVDRTPIANVGLVWSQQNTDFFGRDDAASRVDAPYAGFMHALVRARIPYLPVHIDDVAREAGRLRVLILPNIGAVSDAQAAALRRFAHGGGSIIATGRTGLYDEWGDPRSDFALADLFACHWVGEVPRLQRARGGTTEGQVGGVFAPNPSGHTYLRLSPELRARVDGPKAGDEPSVVEARHPVLRGFDETDILAFGGTLGPLRVDPGAVVPLTFIPAFPTYPPETAWMRQPKTDIAGLVLSERGQARAAYLAADIDRRYATEHLPDHGALLANIVRWAAGGDLPLAVEGTGFIDCHLYQQPGRLIIHLVNLTSEATWRAPVNELIRVGPFRVALRVPPGLRVSRARLLVSRSSRPIHVKNGMANVVVDGILDHELIVME